MLHKVVTTLDYHPDSGLGRAVNLLPDRFRKPLHHELARRTWSQHPRLPVYTHPWRELVRVGLTKSGLDQQLGMGAMGPVDWACRGLDRHVAHHHLDGLNAVYCYEDLAIQTFTAAKARGLNCFYELPIIFHAMSQRLQQEEAEQFPEFAPVLQAAREPYHKIERKNAEIHLADRIFVPSSIVRQSLLEAGIGPEKIVINAYGAPVDYFQPYSREDATFRTLFVGRVGPRKGVHYLLQAWQQLNFPDAELWLVGTNDFPANWLSRYEDQLRHTPCVPHAMLHHYYTRASVLVLPSLVEGLALVQMEAMACGIPVITTENAGGADILTDGVEGFIVPVRDVDALKAKLEWCYRHPDELAEMGRAARRRAEQLTWERYRQRLVAEVRRVSGWGG
jgi:glycosyltransferase involved in cell wall biosynthesis